MTAKEFDIKLIDLHWIKNEDDHNDLCAHGHVYVKIGEAILSDKNSGDWTVSATALLLLRSLTSDYTPDKYGSQLLPCCGHFMMADKDKDYVEIIGCPSGIDWTIKHDGNKVIHTADDGQEAKIDFDEYKNLVLQFADQVEYIYKDSTAKNLPSDDSDLQAYLKFWKEWRIHRNRWK